MSSLLPLAFAIVLALFTPLAARTQESAPVQGDWTLNRDLTPAPLNRDDDVRRPEGRRPPGGGRSGGFPGSGGSPAGRFGGGGPGGARGSPSEKEMRKLQAVRRRIEEVPQRLLISIDGARVQVVDELGRTTNLRADGKKQDRLTGDGEFKSITKLDGGHLIVEEDFDGPKVTTTYARLISDGVSRLQVTLQIDGMPEGRGGRGDQGSRAPITRIYDAGKQAQ